MPIHQCRATTASFLSVALMQTREHGRANRCTHAPVGDAQSRRTGVRQRQWLLTNCQRRSAMMPALMTLRVFRWRNPQAVIVRHAPR